MLLKQNFAILENAPIHTHALPNHVILYMLSFLNPEDLIQLMKVSKAFYHLANDNRLWFNHYAQEKGLAYSLFNHTKNYKNAYLEEIKGLNTCKNIVNEITQTFSNFPFTQEAGFIKLLRILFSTQNLSLLDKPELVLLGALTFELKLIENQWRRLYAMNQEALQDPCAYAQSPFFQKLYAGRNKISSLCKGEGNPADALYNGVNCIDPNQFAGSPQDYYANKEAYLNEIKNVYDESQAASYARLNRY